MKEEDKILELINEYKTQISHPLPESAFHKEIRDRVRNSISVHNIYVSLWEKGIKDFPTSYTLSHELVRVIKIIIAKYDPEVSTKLASKKEVEVNAVNKRGIKAGKRTTMKFGRWVGQAFPFLTDSQKECLINWYSDNYGTIYATFHRATTGFESIVTKHIGKKVGFSTTDWQKSLSDSCMRFSARDLGLSEHPYSAYESGDWELCYLLDEDHKLLGRCLVNIPTGTHSAIYGSSSSAVRMLQEEMCKLGYTKVSSSAEEWSGSRLLYTEDTWYDQEQGEEFEVHLAPYLDIFDGYAYHNRKHIYLSASGDLPKGSRSVNPQDTRGVNEI